MAKRRPTTKDIALLRQLYADDQLTLAPEFQRNSVWPRAAKAYLIDTLLADRPIPLFFFARVTSPQTGRPAYEVIDGQQRLRAVFEFIDGRFRLGKTSSDSSVHGKRFSGLTPDQQNQILNYDIVVEELTGYSDSQIRDIFIRLNKYVVKLSPQELRHARTEGAFAEYVEDLGNWDYWRTQRVFTPTQLRRMRAVEFSAELAILLIEEPQDKKSVIDLYYGQYQSSFPEGRAVRTKLTTYLDWIAKAVPNFSNSRYRRPVDLYAFVGAVDQLVARGRTLSKLDPTASGKRLRAFEAQTRLAHPTGAAARYVVAASRQTDNIAPRSTRIEILRDLLVA